MIEICRWEGVKYTVAQNVLKHILVFGILASNQILEFQ